MQIAEGTATKTITISGATFEVPQPFAEGHVCTPGEAAGLNQLLAENVRNNMRTKVTNGLDESKPEDAEVTQADIDAYIAEYEFGVIRSGGTRRVVDPVEKEARKIARTKLVEALKAKGRKVSDFEAEQIDGLVDQILEQYPQIMDTAKTIVEQRSELGISIDV